MIAGQMVFLRTPSISTGPSPLLHRLMNINSPSQDCDSLPSALSLNKYSPVFSQPNSTNENQFFSGLYPNLLPPHLNLSISTHLYSLIHKHQQRVSSSRGCTQYSPLSHRQQRGTKQKSRKPTGSYQQFLRAITTGPQDRGLKTIRTR